MKDFRLLSPFRKLYQNRFWLRCGVVLMTVLLYLFAPGQFNVLYHSECFRRFSVFHILWLFWMVDMVLQLIPCRQYWPLGSQKFLKACFRPIVDKINHDGLLNYVKKCNRDTLRIGLVWLALILAVGGCYFAGLIDREMLLVIAVVFYLCDIICVLFWCPFRVWFMKNRCCTTCRIFNWDHMMMFSPLVFIPGLYTWSLCAMAFLIFLVWEITFATHPERFWDGSNSALTCANCTDKLCKEQNCQLNRKK